MYKLLYPSIRVRTAPPVSVRVRTRVSVSFSLRILFCMCGSFFAIADLNRRGARDIFIGDDAPVAPTLSVRQEKRFIYSDRKKVLFSEY